MASQLRSGLFGVYTGLVDADLLGLMRAEAEGFADIVTDARCTVDRPDEGRGGTPARAFLTAPGGAVQDAFYAAGWLAAAVSDLVGRSCTPTAGRGTYNYYVRPGDHLALHRDIEECDVSVITGVVRDDPAGAGGGRLLLHPHCAAMPLSRARVERDERVVALELQEGQTLVMLGGRIPHRLTPMGERQARIVSVLCFRFAGPG